MRVANLDHSLGEFQRFLRAGKVAAADALLGKPGTTVDDFLAKWPKSSVEGMSAATSIAELQFVLGHDDVANRCLEPYAPNLDLVAAPLAARQKLQLAEYHYSSFKVPKAITIAERILSEATAAGDRLGVSEARFYLARYRLRMDHSKEANDECMLGLESLHRVIVTTDDGRQERHWHTGRLLRVRGTALWQQGRLTEAKAVLYLSAWILREAFGDAPSLHVGDALLALGRLLRSDDVSRHEEAIQSLEEARRHYENHDLKVARTLIELARTRHNMALANLAGTMADAKRISALFAASRASLSDALDITGRRCIGTKPPKVWRRQKAEALLWRCWLALESTGRYRSVSQAHEDATKALDESTQIGSRKSDLVEAKIALGRCEMELGNLKVAKDWFEDALGQADELEQQNPKLRVHACLSLAQLECRTDGSVMVAQGHLDEALRSVDSNSEISSYLTAKAATVRADIRKLAASSRSLVLTPDMQKVLPEGWDVLDAFERRARKWVVDSLGKDVSNEQAAKLLKTSPKTVRSIKRKGTELEEAIKSRHPIT